jgi:hypothetical protein
MGHRGIEQPHLSPYRIGLTLYGLGEIRKKLIREFFCRPVDQALAELSQLAADLRLDIIA